MMSSKNPEAVSRAGLESNCFTLSNYSPLFPTA